MGQNIVSAPPRENYFTITRDFEAPRALVYKCYTEPQHMAHFWGPRDSTLAVCRIDLRVGGVWRVEWRFADGTGWGYSSVYLEIVPQERLHYRDAPHDWTFGLDGLPEADLVSTIELTGTARGTMVTVTVRCTSVAARDETVKRGFTGMVGIGHDRLAEYLVTLDRADA
jgi:uncharacterized protein YndB with AHSA1/START domain